jgi:hypothetical protein
VSTARNANARAAASTSGRREDRMLISGGGQVGRHPTEVEHGFL